MLVVAVFAHSVTSRLMTKIDKYPLRLLVVRILEISGKAIIIPFVLVYFLGTFTSYGTEASRDLIFLTIVCFVCILLFREFRGFVTDYKDAMTLVRVKVDNPAEYTLTAIELIVLNLHMFSKCSRSAAHYHRWKREVNKNEGSSDALDVEMSAIHLPRSGSNSIQRDSGNDMRDTGASMMHEL